MNSNTEEFLNFWKNYQFPDVKPIFFRLYYNDQGEPVTYTMEDLPGKYIEITAEQFSLSDPHVIVKNEQIIKLNVESTSKLIPDSTGTPCAIDDVAVVVDSSEPHVKWNLKKYVNS